MISEVNPEAIGNAGNKGPQIKKTERAQEAVDEFLASGMDACSVEWRSIDPDFDMAKRAVAYRISHSKSSMLDGSADLAMRSNRAKAEIYLVHADRQ